MQTSPNPAPDSKKTLTFSAFNIFLFNLYLIPLMQVFFNWQLDNCNTYSSIFQLLFYITLYLRVILDELHKNGRVGEVLGWGGKIFTSLGMLVPLVCYEIYVIVKQSSQFDNLPDGTVTACFQNRIVYVAEIILGLLILVKDAVQFVMKTCGKSCQEEDADNAGRDNAVRQ